MKSYSGEIVSGTGHMSQRMSVGSVALDLYEEATDLTLVPGSLNVQLEDEIDMPANSRQIVRNDHEGEAIIYIAPAVLNDLNCFVVRNKKAEDGIGRHSKRVVEIISSHKLRDELQLKDGDKVTLQF